MVKDNQKNSKSRIQTLKRSTRPVMNRTGYKAKSKDMGCHRNVSLNSNTSQNSDKIKNTRNKSKSPHASLKLSKTSQNRKVNFRKPIHSKEGRCNDSFCLFVGLRSSGLSVNGPRVVAFVL